MIIHHKYNFSGYGSWNYIVTCTPYVYGQPTIKNCVTNWKKVTCKKCLKRKKK